MSPVLSHSANGVQPAVAGREPAVVPARAQQLPARNLPAHTASSAAKDTTATVKQWEILGVTMKRDEVIVNLGLAVVGAFLISLLFPAIGRGLKELFIRARLWWRPSTELISFAKQEPQEASKNFVPHALQRWDATRREWQPEAAAQADSLRYFMEEVMRSPHQAYLLLGPTGIGKTTFLLSLYARYATETPYKNAPRLLLGRVSDMQKLEETLLARIADKTSGNTILLLDALDEYQYAHTLNASFDAEFTHFWATFRRDKAPHFKKVIVAAREQFFQNQMQEDLLGDGRAVRLRLLPFDQPRQEKWITKFYKEKPSSFQSGLQTLNLAIAERGHDFMRIPLLLSFLESLFQEQEDQTKAKKYAAATFFIDHNMMRLLVRKWLNREAADKGLDPEYLARFCQLLAAELSQTLRPTGLSVKELQALENQEFFDAASVITAFGGRNDRSLLKRTVTNEGFCFEFVHERFLGYFLALYAEEKPENALRIPFERHPYALRYLVGKRWRERLQLPLPAYQKPEAGDNVVPLPVLRAWGEVLDGLISDCNEATRTVFREEWEEILEKEAPDWRKSFREMEELIITPANLARAEDTVAQTGIRYLRNFVTKVSLQHAQPTNNELAPLLGAQQISWLDLRDTNLPAAQLVIFARSAPLLTILALTGIDLSTDSPAWFAHTERLTALSLHNTQLPAARLTDFAHCAPLLTILGLTGIDLSTECPVWFARTERLTELNLQETRLPATQLAGFARNALHLTILWLDSINLSTEYPTWFAYTERLTELNLQDTKLPAARLADFARSAPHLTRLWLSDIDLSTECPAWFAHTERLTTLSLNRTQLPAARLIDFARSAPYLTSLRLASIDLSTEYPTWFAYTERLTELNLQNTNIPAARLADFARSAPHLTRLWLSDIDLSTECPAWFAHTERLTDLALDDTKLPAAKLADFARSAPHLTFLWLNGIDLSTDSPAWFAHTEQLTDLSLQNTKLSAARLADFARSAPRLTNLWLDGIDLSTDSPAWFAHTERLNELGLHDTRLPATRLTDFARSAPHLTILGLAGIDLSTECPAWFARTERLTRIGLRDTWLPAVELAAFASRAPYLLSVGLGSIDLHTDAPTWFAELEQLTELGLNNTQLLVAQLAAFAPCAPHLTYLGLTGIDLSMECPAWFAQTRQLTELSLKNTSLPSHVLAHFKASALSLTALDISQNPDITEASFACFGEHQERLMALAEKNGWSRTGPNFPAPPPVDASPTDSSSPSA